MRLFKGLYLEVTRKCNLRCLHCYNESGNEFEMPLEKIIELLDNAYSLNNKFSLAISGGEFFKHSHFNEIIEYCINKQIDTTIVTNGTLIKSDFVNNIAKFENIKFQISIDGIGDVNDLIRGKGTFEKINKTLDLFIEKNLISKITAHYVINNLNYSCIEETIDYLTKKGVKNLDFNMVVNQGRTLDNCETLVFKDYQSSYNRIKKEIYDLSLKYPEINIGNIDTTYSCPIFNDNNADFNIKIDTLGNIYLCQLFNGNSAVVGNIYNNSLEEALYNDNVDIFIQKVIKIFNTNQNCKKCLWKICCKRGCPAKYFTNLDVDTYYADCEILKNKYKKVLKNEKT